MPKSKSKRHPKNQHSSSLPQRLISAWKKDDESVFDVFDEMSRQPNPDKNLGIALSLLPDHEKSDFLHDMFDIASLTFPSIKKSDGTFLDDARLQLFTVALYGVDHDMEVLLKNPIFNEITKQVRASSYAASESNVILVPFPLDIISATNATPFDVRRLTEALTETAVIGGATDYKPIIKSVFGDQFSGSEEQKTEKGTVVSRLLFGVRLIGEGNDLFDPPDDEAEPYEEILEQLLQDREDASLRFMNSANEICENNNIRISISNIASWVEGMRDMALFRLQGMLDLMAGVSGVNLSKADTAHLVYDQDLFYVAVMSSQNTLIGPVDLPAQCLAYCAEDIFDWLSEEFDEIISHENLQSLLSLTSSIIH